ncbi:MAG: DUF971 domain-containing protein [Bdellovibrionales bacterium]|nr:DUF971 domain-containing protein [Bdellovibrionales bacterium]
MKPQPTEIKRLGTSGIQVTWSTGAVHKISSETLRRHCPSATSRAQQGDESHQKPLTGRSVLKVVEHTKDEQLRLQQIWAVGNYALGMEWGDGHNSGIYTYDLLFQLGSKEASLAADATKDA